MEHERKMKIEERNMKIKEAKLTGLLMTCECCFEEDLLLEDLLGCSKDHLFCKNCIRRQAEVNLGLNKLQFPCFNGYCNEQFELKILEKCLLFTTYSTICDKLQQREVESAALPDLFSCPFCPFSAIYPDPNDKIFKCLNPKCLKETCRLCKELNHVPLHCNQVEKKSEMDMRIYIENKMSESLLRVCPKCKCRFIKLKGCNKMTCTCGQMMCYVCKQPITGYDHFGRNASFGKCLLNSDTIELHRNEVTIGAEIARGDYLDSHPELGNLQLKYDPINNFMSPQSMPNRNYNTNTNKRKYTTQNGVINDKIQRVSLNDNLWQLLDQNRQLTNYSTPIRKIGSSATATVTSSSSSILTCLLTPINDYGIASTSKNQ